MRYAVEFTLDWRVNSYLHYNQYDWKTYRQCVIYVIMFWDNMCYLSIYTITNTLKCHLILHLSNTLNRNIVNDLKLSNILYTETTKNFVMYMIGFPVRKGTVEHMCPAMTPIMIWSDSLPGITSLWHLISRCGWINSYRKASVDVITWEWDKMNSNFNKSVNSTKNLQHLIITNYNTRI